MERYLSPSQFNVGLTMQVGPRNASLAPILLDKLDMVLFRSRGLDFIEGLRSRFEHLCLPEGKPSKEDSLAESAQFWNNHITNDHDLFRAFENINCLARSNQIPNLYYTEQINLRGQMEWGLNPRIHENYELILNRLEAIS